ncbi:MAG: P-loop NTPase [Proteobacteria bacterium]|nr:P-loop NTPase [Pseudomonadota bacterium]
MAQANRRVLARSLKDITDVNPDQLRGDRPRPVLVSAPAAEPVPEGDDGRSACQVICVASGKGGTGKTVVTTNLAVSLVQQGLDVLLFDADLGLANAHVLLGVSPPYDISQVVSGERRLDEVVVECHAGVKLISGGSGFSDLAELKDWQVRNIADQLKVYEDHADVILVDLSAGISPQVMRFLNTAHDVIVVTTPDVTALLDAYATVKSMSRGRAGLEVKVVVNRARNEGEARAAFEKMQSVVSRHLEGVTLSMFEWIPFNWYVQNSVNMRQPVVLLHPKSFVTRTFSDMASRLKGENARWKERARSEQADRHEGGALSFARRLARMVFK